MTQLTTGACMTLEEFTALEKGNCYVAIDMAEIRVYDSKGTGTANAKNTTGKQNKLEDMRWPSPREFEAYTELGIISVGPKPPARLPTQLPATGQASPIQPNAMAGFNTLEAFLKTLPVFRLNPLTQIHKLESRIRDLTHEYVAPRPGRGEAVVVEEIRRLGGVYAFIYAGGVFEPESYDRLFGVRPETIVPSPAAEAKEAQLPDFRSLR